MTSLRYLVFLLVVVLHGGGCATSSTSANIEAANAASAEQIIPRATQELLDALPHNAAVWQRYLSDRVVYVSEAGDVATKQEVLEGFAPFPEGITGSIKVKTVKLSVHGDVAVHVFEAHETQTIYGQPIEVNYRSTHTWRLENGEWRVIAAHNLVLARDPAPVPIRASLADYVGTYDLAGKRRYRVERRGDVLVGGREGGELRPLIAVGENVFFDAGSNLGILRIFLRGDGGITGMVQRRKFADTTWTKLPAGAEAQ